MKMKKTVVGLIGLSKKQKVTQRQNVKKHIILDNLSYGHWTNVIWKIRLWTNVQWENTFYGQNIILDQSSNGQNVPLDSSLLDNTCCWTTRLREKPSQKYEDHGVGKMCAFCGYKPGHRCGKITKYSFIFDPLSLVSCLFTKSIFEDSQKGPFNFANQPVDNWQLLLSFCV